MATCFDLFYVIFRPILIKCVQVKSSIHIPYNWHIHGESTFTTCGADSSFGIATGYDLDGPGIESRCGRYFPHMSDRPSSPPSLLYNGFRVFSGVKSGRYVKLTPHPLLVPWSRNSRAIPLLPLCAVLPVQSLSGCTVQLYLYSPYEPYCLYRASACTVQLYLCSSMERTACTVPQCLNSRAIPLLPL